MNSEDRFRELAALPENWNGYGSPPVNADAIEESFNLLSELGKLDMPEPRIVPVSGGGVQIEWDSNGVSLEIEVFPDRSIHYLIVGRESEMDVGKISEKSTLISVAQEYLSKVSGRNADVDPPLSPKRQLP